MRLDFSTRDFAPDERFEAFAAVASRAYIRHQCSTLTPAAFSSSVSGRTIGDIKLINTSTNGMLARRTAADCRAAAPDVLHLRRVVSGYAIATQEERVAELVAGQMYLIDPCRPFAVATDAHHEDLEISRPALEARVGPVGNLLCRAIPGSTDFAQMLQGFSNGLFHRLSSAADETETSEITGLQLLDLAALAIRPHSAVGASLASQATILRMRLHHAISTSVAVPHIAAQDVAARAGMSASDAEDLLADEGTTIARELLYQRLEALRKSLTERRSSRRRIDDEMLRFGFTSYPELERVFRGFYGVSPADYRLQVLRAKGYVSAETEARANRARRSFADVESLFRSQR